MPSKTYVWTGLKKPWLRVTYLKTVVNPMKPAFEYKPEVAPRPVQVICLNLNGITKFFPAYGSPAAPCCYFNFHINSQ